mmetsp:Transcript_113091/g.320362  ORF Transcript_113091/g.320362 Transcript_113091/m.320362 type:complete len:206 (-) Transcript_113091:109-726(-)
MGGSNLRRPSRPAPRPSSIRQSLLHLDRLVDPGGLLLLEERLHALLALLRLPDLRVLLGRVLDQRPRRRLVRGVQDRLLRGRDGPRRAGLELLGDLLDDRRELGHVVDGPLHQADLHRRWHVDILRGAEHVLRVGGADGPHHMGGDHRGDDAELDLRERGVRGPHRDRHVADGQEPDAGAHRRAVEAADRELRQRGPLVQVAREP